MSTQLIDFESGSPTTGDSGERADTVAIKPIVPGDRVQSAVIDRPLENLRARTEELRGKVEELLYRADADKWVITGGNNIGQVTVPGVAAFPTVSWNSTTGIFTMSAHAVIQPFMAPNTDLFATQTYVFDATDTFAFAANDDALAGDILYDYQLANSIRIIWETATLGVGVFCTATLEGNPDHILRIIIRDDNTTNAAHVETALNLILGPAIPASPLKFTLTGPGTTFLDLTDIAGYTNVVMTGTYSRELHYLSTTQLNAFFATPANVLSVDGDGIGIWYEELTDSTLADRGGRRQATPTTLDDGTGLAPSTEVPSTKLFKFSTEPAKIPGAIPLCRRIGTYLVFVDGTVVGNGQTVQFGQSGLSPTWLQLADQAGADAGNTTIGCDAIVDSPSSLAAGTLRAQTVELLGHVNDRTVITDLAEDTGAASGATLVGSEAIADTPTSLIRGTVTSQTTALLTAVNARARIASPELITGNWQRLGPVISKDYHQNIDLSTRLDLSSHGGAWGPTVEFSDISRKAASTGNNIYWGNPKASSNDYHLLPQAHPIIGQCVCNVPISATYTPTSGMLSRVLVSLSGNVTTPRIYLTDPLDEFNYTAIDLSSYLPVGGPWVGTAICAVTDTRIAAMFTDETDHIVQCWDITDGTTINFSVVSGWGTGVVLPGTGPSVWAGDAIIASYTGSVLFTLNSWDAGNQGHIISAINVATHVVTSSGIGDALGNSTTYATGGLMCDTLYVYFTTLDYSSHIPRLCSATQLNLAVGAGGDLPKALGDADNEICCSLAFDGINIYAPVKTPSSASAAIWVYDVTDKRAAAISDPNFGGADASLYGELKYCCFDGVNLWVQEVAFGQLYLWAIDVGTIDSASGCYWRDVTPRRFPILRYSEINTDGGVTYANLGPITHDGSSVFTALESVGTSTLSSDMRRVTRACHR